MRDLRAGESLTAAADDMMVDSFVDVDDVRWIFGCLSEVERRWRDSEEPNPFLPGILARTFRRNNITAVVGLCVFRTREIVLLIALLSFRPVACSCGQIGPSCAHRQVGTPESDCPSAPANWAMRRKFHINGHCSSKVSPYITLAADLLRLLNHPAYLMFSHSSWTFRESVCAAIPRE